MKKALVVQVLASAVVAFQASQTGLMIGWPSTAVGTFSSDSSVLTRTMSTFEISLFGSLMNIGALVTSPFCGTIFNKFGRKYAAISFGLPFVLSWAIISVTSDVTLVLVAMALSGIGAAGQATSPIFITELAEDSVRGGLSASCGTGFFIGILLSYILGGYFSYRAVVRILLSLSILSVILLMMMKESPVYLVLVGKNEEAAKSLAFYRWTEVTSKEVQTELAKIKRQMDPNLESMLMKNDESQSARKEDTTQQDSENPMEINAKDTFMDELKFLINSRSSRRALIVTSALLSMSVLIAVQVYAEPLFKAAVPSMPSNSCAILLAIIFLIASLLCVVLVDKCGRRVLLMVSSLASGVCCVLLGTQLQLGWAPPWFSALLIYVYSFVYTIGAAVIPFIVLSEVFLPEVRALCNSIVLLINWCMCFITVLLFNQLQEVVGPGPIFHTFAGVGFFCVVFTYFYLPETRGLSVEEIQLAFLKSLK